MYIPHPDPIKYVGEPSDEIDQNWERLTWGRYIVISEQEAHASWGRDIDQYWDNDRNGYVAGLDMFHTLHCLGSLRRALHPEHYHTKATISDDDLHHDHCIEQVYTLRNVRKTSIVLMLVDSTIHHVLRRHDSYTDKILSATWEELY